MSPSTRRAWIEMRRLSARRGSPRVALHPEGVDRNAFSGCILLWHASVALHPEGVDRNALPNCFKSRQFRVALHPEGVDRNDLRGASGDPRALVALHPEGVDRNLLLSYICLDKLASPSTRRAWIEIKSTATPTTTCTSPSTRRAWIEIARPQTGASGF